MRNQAEFLQNEGIAALMLGDCRMALQHLEAASRLEANPTTLSHLALCIAKERRDFSKALTLCGMAISEEPWNSVHYLNLGKVHLLDGQKRDAIRVFRDGLLHESNPIILEELRLLGTRKYPVIPSLSRDHRLNIFLGKLLKRFKLR